MWVTTPVGHKEHLHLDQEQIGQLQEIKDILSKEKSVCVTYHLA